MIFRKGGGSSERFDIAVFWDSQRCLRWLFLGVQYFFCVFLDNYASESFPRCPYLSYLLNLK